MQPLRKLGPYTLIKRIAGGGMADIFLAKTRGVGGEEKFLALKMIRENFAGDEEFIEMLVNEAKIAVRLHHEHIVQVFDLGKVDGQYFIAMEFIDGRDLQALLVETAKQDRYVPYEASAFIIRNACAGLHYAHTRLDEGGRPLCIVHRDMSPQNVLLSFNGDVKITDFGIAKANIARTETQIGVIKGKFCYMSPEQAWADKLDNRSDVFSLGVVLYELLTGEMLYQDEEQLRLLDRVRRAQIPPPTAVRKGIPSDLEAIVMMALERDRKDRFMSGAALQLELTRYLSKASPNYSQSDLQDYLRDVFKVESSEFEREVRALDPAVETRHAVQVGQPRASGVGSRVLDRADFQPQDDLSLVHDFRALAALAKAATVDEPTAPEGVKALAKQESTRPIRFTADMVDAGPDLEIAPTRAHSRSEIEKILANGIAEEEEEEDPTMLYSSAKLRDALLAPGGLAAFEQAVTPQGVKYKGGLSPLAGPTQAPDGSWDPQSEAILLASSDLMIVDENDDVSAGAYQYAHPLQHGSLEGGGYRPQPSLLSPDAFASYASPYDIENAKTRPSLSAYKPARRLPPDAAAAAAQESERGRLHAHHERFVMTNHGAETALRTESYSALWLIAGSLFVLGVIAVIVVVVAG